MQARSKMSPAQNMIPQASNLKCAGEVHLILYAVRVILVSSSPVLCRVTTMNSAHWGPHPLRSFHALRELVWVVHIVIRIWVQFLLWPCGTFFCVGVGEQPVAWWSGGDKVILHSSRVAVWSCDGRYSGCAVAPRLGSKIPPHTRKIRNSGAAIAASHARCAVRQGSERVFLYSYLSVLTGPISDLFDHCRLLRWLLLPSPFNSLSLLNTRRD